MSTAPAISTPHPTIPHERGLPLVGSTFAMVRNGGNYFQTMRMKHGNVFSAWFAGKKITCLLGPDANQLVLTNAKMFTSKQEWEYFIGPFFHRGLMLLDGDEHRLHRRIMQSAFSKEALASYVQLMQPRIAHDIAEWQPGDNFLMFNHLKQLALNIGNEVFVGHAPGPEADAMNKSFLATVRAGTSFIRFALPGSRWQKGLQGRKLLEQFFLKEIALKRANPGSDLFSRLCEAKSEEGELFSDEDVLNHMIFVLMAAHDTSTITLTNILYLTAKNPEWQERLRAQSQALGEVELDQASLAALTDADLVMKEALRMCAPLPYMPRHLEEAIEFEGYQLEAGSAVMTCAWDSHYDENFWSEPAKFDPERFSPERAEDKKHRFQWVPFGGGAHKCIGLHFGEMEVKSVLHQLLLKYRWSVPEDYVMPQDFTSLPIPKDRLPLRLERL